MRLFPRFMLSALSAEQFPESTVPEFAFLGRSNVGKSSLINALLGSKEAKVSSTPGRTRAINFFALSDTPQKKTPRFLFADLPGYGYAKISKSISAEWPKFIEPYLANRAPLTMCICLIDSNIPPQPSDAQLIGYLHSTGRKHLVVATKSDRLSGNARTKAYNLLKNGLEVEKILMVSAKTGAGMKDLWAAIEAAADEVS
jgi:GTP-binding protein